MSANGVDSVRVTLSDFLRGFGFYSFVDLGVEPIQELDSWLIRHGYMQLSGFDAAVHFCHESKPYHRGTSPGYYQLIFSMPDGNVLIPTKFTLVKDRKTFIECIKLEIGKTPRECGRVAIDINNCDPAPRVILYKRGTMPFPSSWNDQISIGLLNRLHAHTFQPKQPARKKRALSAKRA